MIKPPCYKCNSRSVGCHNNCEKYAEYKVIIAEKKTKEFHSRCAEKIMNEYQLGKTRRRRKDKQW
jgi:hypothetical protein